ncbi:hypothetical protein [Umezawaea beigongshangensis]|uniref:hypothetical protein n=1 Tax=Umezawaea beigongshangensis TaxID=2780383 RepID=UPI0018F16AE9|nr:hypothetical protein [Umezawaea beigongshangensis]
MRVRHQFAAVVGAAALLLTACGGDDGGGGVASLNSPGSAEQAAGKGDEKSDGDKMREWAKCMRDNGVDVPDPRGEDGVAVAAAPPENDEGMRKADEECRPLLPNGGELRKPSAEQLDRMREMAKCLRENGIDAQDPNPDTGQPGQMDTAGVPEEELTRVLEKCSDGEGAAVPAVPAPAK